MQVITDLSRPAWTDGTGGRSVLTIGAYDGVHLGHQAVIREVRRQAAELGARSVVVTFDQDYRSNSLSNVMKKRQYWVREEGKWKIIYEGAA